MEYAVKTGVSLSTLRRYIKAQKIEFKKENGRYFLLESDVRAPEPFNGSAAFNKLEGDLKKAQEEIAELKTLVALYEEQFHHRLDR